MPTLADPGDQAEPEDDGHRPCAEADSRDQCPMGVVASAVTGAAFPEDAARRAFLKSVGVSTAPAALVQGFPRKAASEVFDQGASAIETCAAATSRPALP